MTERSLYLLLWPRKSWKEEELGIESGIEVT